MNFSCDEKYVLLNFQKKLNFDNDTQINLHTHTHSPHIYIYIYIVTWYATESGKVRLISPTLCLN